MRSPVAVIADYFGFGMHAEAALEGLRALEEAGYTLVGPVEEEERCEGTDVYPSTPMLIEERRVLVGSEVLEGRVATHPHLQDDENFKQARHASLERELGGEIIKRLPRRQGERRAA